MLIFILYISMNGTQKFQEKTKQNMTKIFNMSQEKLAYRLKVNVNKCSENRLSN